MKATRTALVFLAAALTATAALADGKEKRPRIKVFRLTYYNPSYVRDLLSRLIGGQEPPLAPAPVRAPDDAPRAAPKPVTPRVGADGRTGSVIVRGRPRHLRVAEEVVALLNTPADKPLPGMKTIHVFRLKHAEPASVVAILRELEISGNAYPFRQLLFLDRDADVKTIARLIKELDVPAPAPTPLPQPLPHP
jgi:hypothetical protein